MTIFLLGLSRFFTFVKNCFAGGQHHLADAKLEGLTDHDRQDIGLEPYRHDFDHVKPFWMA
jgi:hypothetical protein